MSSQMPRSAYGYCARCDMAFPLGELVRDGEMNGVRVCYHCYDPYQPQRDIPTFGSDEGALYDPAPPVIRDGEAVLKGQVYDARLNHIPLIPLTLKVTDPKVLL